jgi:hypothetical protein
MGYMLLFTAEDCIEPNMFVINEDDNVYMAKTPFWMNQFLRRRRYEPKVARNKKATLASNTSTSMRITVPLEVFHKYLAYCDKVVTVAFPRWFSFLKILQ